MSNTSEDNAAEALEIKDQETLEQALKEESAEQVKEESSEDEVALTKSETPSKLLGKYETADDLAKAFKALQAEYTQTTQKLKDSEQIIKEAELESIKLLDYDKQQEFLVNRIMELEGKLNEGQQSMQEAFSNVNEKAEEEAIDSFIASTPDLIETGMGDIFKDIATREDMREYSLESIYNVKIKPKIEKLMGVKVKTKERPLLGKPVDPANSADHKDVSNMNKQKYEENREQILREAGINI